MTAISEMRKPLEPALGVPQLVTLEELAKRWALPITWLRESCRSRCADPLPIFRCGRYCRVDLNDPALRSWIERRRTGVKR